MNFIYGMTTAFFISLVTGTTPDQAASNLRGWLRVFGL